MLLGVAFALAAEFFVVQTSLAPLGVLEPYPDYGRAAGVNWPYLVWALGYESLWGIAIPIQLTELTFPLHRTSAWLGARGCAVLTILLVLGAGADWYNWTQLVVVLVLVLGALLLRPAQRVPANADSGPPVPAPVLAGVAAAGAAFLWFTLTVSWAMWGAWARAVPAFVPLLLALILQPPRVCRTALGAECRLVGSAPVGRAQRGIGDRHGGGFVSNDLTDPVNLIGKIVLNAIAVGALARKLRRRSTRLRNDHRMLLNN